MSKKVALIILDGWGHGKDDKVNAIAQARTDYMDSLYEKYPHAELYTHGEHVGLPTGQMGNSEVGHLNIGAGRVVFQELARINNAIADGSLQENKNLQRIIRQAQELDKPVHILGLLSDGGVHSHISHIKAICNYLSTANVSTYIHAFLDGRDTSPSGGKEYVQKILEEVDGTQCKLSSLIGRYYAMDRDKRWERVAKAYRLLVQGEGTFSSNPIESIEANYSKGITDEFMEPIRCLPSTEGCIQDGDLVLFINFRTDRPRQLTEVLTQNDIDSQGMKKLDLDFSTMTEYDSSFSGIHVLFEKEDLPATLGEIVAQNGRTQLRIAETEKYPHVSFFFSGGKEEAFAGESRILVPSPKVATYDLQPEMSAYEITNKVCKFVEENQPDLLVLNYANADMVGHTGDFQAAVKAVETLDACMESLVSQLRLHEYELLIIADHGNSDIMKNPDGSPHTAHTTNLVPIIHVGNYQNIGDGKLADIAPTILKIMGIESPKEMTGQSLL